MTGILRMTRVLFCRGQPRRRLELGIESFSYHRQGESRLIDVNLQPIVQF